MDNKKYYMDLAERWFDAETTEAEELELKRFLAGTDDPDFDEAKAALGYLAAEGAISHSQEMTKKSVRLWPVLAVAASVAVAFVLGRLTATPVEVVVGDPGSYVSYVHGVVVPSEEFAVREMESTLEGLFAPAPDPAADLAQLFSR